MLTQNELRELFNYNPETGVFKRKKHQRWPNATTPDIAGWLNPNGYWYITINNKKYLLHRLAWLYVYGYMPKQLDHINRVSSDNRIANLRESTQSENMQNTSMRSDNTSGFKGVSLMRRDNTWRARIKVDGKSKTIGYYKTQQEAHDTYKREKSKLHTFNPSTGE